jgi:site-specific DNA-cytosine methylase
MRVVVICEFSAVVCDRFIKHGHDAISVDLLPSERPSPHYTGDVFRFLEQDSDFDLAICHPPCTHLAVSGARWFKDKPPHLQLEALEFVRRLMDMKIRRIAIENPISVISTYIRKPDQIIQPWQFGHGEVKATCFWLKNLPLLVPTKVVAGRHSRVHRMLPSPDRWKDRSRTLEGIADAMAVQWGSLKINPLIRRAS